MTSICLVRSPALPRYHDIDIKEDPMLTALLGYFDSIKLEQEAYDIFDFQLDKSITYRNLLKKDYQHYVIAVRDVGESYRYSSRLANFLAKATKGKIWLYGQVSPLRHGYTLYEGVSIVNQSEQELAANIGISSLGAHFTKDLRYRSYFSYLHLDKWQLIRRKGILETSRGCPYKCKFCFINVGQSYEKRWQIRPNDTIISDLKSYIDMGIKQFVFLDSEFLGANPKQHAERKLLLNRIINELPPISYMILCRADTLLAFNQFELFRKSGLKKVLVGVESLYQPDLDLLKKDTTVEKLKSSITKLIESKVECCLTFLTFHRNTTIKGLKQNLEEVESLYRHPNSAYLGMPNFSFNMEVIRDDENEEVKLNEISKLTYLQPLLEARGQKDSSKVCFPSELEPLVEIYRILQYEWVVKKCELIKVKSEQTEQNQKKIRLWFNGLGLFCIEQMRFFLMAYESGELSFQTLKAQSEVLFNNYRAYYSTLPVELRALSTYEHFSTIDYKKEQQIVDHGWDEIIPSFYDESCTEEIYE